MISLTFRQAEVLSEIRHSIATRGYPPTYRELAKRFGWRSMNAVRDHLTALQRRGAIQLDSTSRGIRLTDET